jgi:hypothetical protein
MDDPPAGGSWERVTLPGTLGRGSIVAATSLAAATDGAVLHADLERVLPSGLRRVKPDAVLIPPPASRPRPGRG